MDNLTHSMVGAVLGQLGLKRKSGLGMPTIIIAANIPDIDATCTVLGTQSLALRRGLTHGPLAMLILPVLLAVIMVLVDRWQARRGTRPAGRLPVHFGWLWFIALVGTLSHPAFDWLNSYGVRLLSPFSDRWFYGDTLFIIDIWLWALLIGGYVWARRGERVSFDGMKTRAAIIVAASSAYIFVNGAISGVAQAQGDTWLRQQGRAAETLVANPQPFIPWQREMLWRADGLHGRFQYSLFGSAGPGSAAAPGQPTGMDDPAIEKACAVDPDARAFLFWSRMPLARREANGDLVLSDQRFDRIPVRNSFVIRVPAEALR
ncbi:conserved hypothetical membrane protein [Sphingobium sp. SYK-6]|uniref:metal-dependent hydrolase n=1 Tax=Sphingobium sp. (strain NBRC 103272 / SYK-6) TaxID=627192 RepID=UPI0002277222|nr:metal-dependent hydrolase [Sphingobium sp. SYK-6]BAK66440.1 conserved hypothetical membrane protein [Sphingobium sp. SYK-6]